MLNPKFVFYSPIRTLPADPNALAEHVDHAIIALDGRAPLGGACTLEPLAPVTPREETLRIDLWVNDLGTSTCTYGFLCSSEDGRTPHARGERSVINAGLSPWTPEFVAAHAELQKDLPAYA